jgi:quercetin dioxygenase-like cupin family protein
MKVNRGRESGIPSDLRGPTFTGNVWADPVLATDDDVTVNTVFFPPSARTHWHSHSQGQILFVTHGLGYVQARGGDAVQVGPGDVVYFSGDEVHWHGAGPDGYLTHTAISLGTHDWLDEVSSEDYERSVSGE